MALDLGRAAGSIRKIESGSYAGNYNALGPVSPKTGDRAFGAYQVMGANVPNWTEKYVGERMSPQQFLNNPAAQDKVFQGEFGGYVNRFGSGEAASQAWLGGPGSVGKTARTDFTGTSVGTYSNRFTGGYSDPNNTGGFSGQATNGVTASSDGTVAAAGGTPMVQPAGSVTNYDAAGNVTTNDNNVASSDLPEIGTEGGSNSAVAKGGSASATGSQSGTPQQGNGGTSTSSSAGAGGVGFYMNEVARAIASALSPATTQAGKDVAKATDGVASATKESGTTVAKGATDAAGITSAQSKANATLAADSAKDYFGRIVIILLGIIFVGGGVAMFVFNKNPIKIAKDLVA